MSRSYNISLNGERRLEDVVLSTPSDRSPLHIPNDACLKYLSVVEISRIPLYITVASPFTVSTSSQATEDWFCDIFLSAPAEPDQAPWWAAACRDSPYGVLVDVQGWDDSSKSSKPRVTELLLYASHGSIADTSLTPASTGRNTLGIQAIALSSDLLYQVQNPEPTPPASPVAEQTEIDACFLPALFTSDVINEPPVRKRKTATDAFDQASERRKKARRRGGEGVAAAASTKTNGEAPSLQHRRTGSYTQSLDLQRRLSRSPSITSRPPTAATQGQRPSTLSRVESVTTVTDAGDHETKNKDIISRIVMAGMRLHGLSQSKSRKHRAGSSAPSPSVDATFDELEAERKNDEEFKLVYHQVFKGTCFAFRGSIADRSLQPFSGVIRDVADKLLTIFCNDSIMNGFASETDKITTTGREAFGARIR